MKKLLIAILLTYALAFSLNAQSTPAFTQTYPGSEINSFTEPAMVQTALAEAQCIPGFELTGRVQAR